MLNKLIDQYSLSKFIVSKNILQHFNILSSRDSIIEIFISF